MAQAMPRCFTCAVLIAWIMTAGTVLLAQTNSPLAPSGSFPNPATSRAEAPDDQALTTTKLGDYHLQTEQPSQKALLLTRTPPEVPANAVVKEPRPLPPIPTRAPIERIQSIPQVEPVLETAIALPPLRSPISIAEPVFVRSQLPRISAIPQAKTALEGVQLKVRPVE
jgi:hypothetical protein